MTVEQLRDAYKATPFKPFTLRLADDRGVPVRDQELIITSPCGRTVVVFEPDGRLYLFDSSRVVGLEFGLPDG